MFKKLVSLLICMSLVFVSIAPAIATNSRENPERIEIEEKLEALAKKRGVPSVIAKSVARVESCFQQYTSRGGVYTGSRGSIGIMQINNRYGDFDTNKLKFDIDYNLEAGIEMLLRKWEMAVNKLPQIGNMDPNILEHWYFALWAYNGWADSNNPNTGKKKYTYTELIYKVAKEEYGQEITLIDEKLLPRSGKPSKEKHFDTPVPIHKGDIVIYRAGQPMIADVDSSLNLRNEPGGRVVGKLESQEKIEIVSGPQVVGGYYWYEVKNENKKGWVAGNWITLDELVTTYHGGFEIKDDNTPLRDMPFGSIEVKLDKGVKLEIVSKPYFDGNVEWLQVESETGDKGWLENYLVKSIEAETNVSNIDTLAVESVETKERTYVKPGEEDHAIVVVETKKQEPKEEPKEESKEEPKEESKEELKQELIEEPQIVEEKKAEIKYALVDVTSSLNIRSEATTKSEKVGKLYNKDMIQLISEPITGDKYTWYKIKDTRSGQEGWVASEFIILQ